MRTIKKLVPAALAAAALLAAGPADAKPAGKQAGASAAKGVKGKAGVRVQGRVDLKGRRPR